MNIREWFGYRGDVAFNTETDICFDKLLNLYADGLKQFFSVMDAKCLTSLIQKSKKNGSLNKQQILFLEWIEEKGIDLITKYAYTSIPNDKTLIAQLEYEIYALECEIDVDYPDEIISTIIDTTNLLPNIIDPVLELSATTEESTDYIDEYEYEYEDEEENDLMEIFNSNNQNECLQTVQQVVGTYINPRTHINSYIDLPEHSLNFILTDSKRYIEKMSNVKMNHISSYSNQKIVYYNEDKKESAEKAGSFFWKKWREIRWKKMFLKNINLCVIAYS
ncbi:hypothetical protein ACWKS6_26245 [Bacillus cereus]